MASDHENLFSRSSATVPLPAKMRPASFTEFYGQSELIDRLRDRPIHSMILYGPPGCGKTTLASLLARQSGLPFESISAVSSGIKEVRAVIEKGKELSSLGRGMVLFIDEIHRFSKNQQDALLEAVESGWIILVGATTENPSFEVIGPLLSRCQVYRLRSLDAESLEAILERALKHESLEQVSLDDRAKEMIVELSGGDARKMLRILETAAGQGERITPENISAILQDSVRNYDKLGENHYDFISAFIKSLRGSDPDAALLYMAAMLEAGEDPLFIARRMVIFASEDVGNASPQALTIAVSAFEAIERIGMPESRIILAQAATFLAASPKSNASYKAIDAALRTIRDRAIAIPNHLRNAPTATHRAEGAAKGYLYPHDHPGHFVEQQYMPSGFEKAQFYFPGDSGQEAKLKERLRSLRPDRRY